MGAASIRPTIRRHTTGHSQARRHCLDPRGVPRHREELLPPLALPAVDRAPTGRSRSGLNCAADFVGQPTPSALCKYTETTPRGRSPPPARCCCAGPPRRARAAPPRGLSNGHLRASSASEGGHPRNCKPPGASEKTPIPLMFLSRGGQSAAGIFLRLVVTWAHCYDLRDRSR